MAITKGAFSCRRCYVPGGTGNPLPKGSTGPHEGRSAWAISPTRCAARKIYCHSTWNRSSTPPVDGHATSIVHSLPRAVCSKRLRPKNGCGWLAQQPKAEGRPSITLSQDADVFALGPTSNEHGPAKPSEPRTLTYAVLQNEVPRHARCGHSGAAGELVVKGHGGERREITSKSIFEDRYRCKWDPKN
jgi:hypothetical protein